MNPLVTVLCVLYVISPIDVLPDVIPILGWIDDVGVIAYLVSNLMSQPPQDSQKIDKS